MLPKDFYENVEIPGSLKRVLYSDSVSKQQIINVKFTKFNNIISLNFEGLWNTLTEDCKLKVEGNELGKQFIFFNGEIQVETFDFERKEVIWVEPEYIMRHYVEDKLVQLVIHDYLKTRVEVTENHSMIEAKNYKIVDPMRIKSVINNKLEVYKIKKRKKIPYKGFVYDLAVPKTNNFFSNNILVHNTDSIFITIPSKKDLKQMSVEEKWQLVLKTAERINQGIIRYLKEYYLPRSNINPEHNMTDFKSELLMNIIYFTGVKKNYAYKLQCKEGKIVDPPKTKYTGIQVVKSDTSKLTQNMLNEMISDVMLNIDITNKTEALIEIINKYQKKFQKDCDEFYFNDIGLPGKWGKKILHINGMKLYNYLMNEEIFSMGSSGRFIYCRFRNKSLFSGIDLEKTSGICVPYEYDSNKLQQLMNQYGITIDKKTHWSKLFSTTCDRVIQSCNNLG